MLDVKKLLVKLLTRTKTTFSPSKGSSYAGWGGCYYETNGRIVHLHLGISGLTAGSGNVVYTMPAGLRPTSDIMFYGSSGAVHQICYVSVASNGTVTAYPQSNTYCGGDIMYLI